MPENSSKDTATVNSRWFWPSFLRELKTHRFLLYQLVKVNFLEEFKKSRLGVFKSAIAPVLGTLIWLVFNEVGLFNPGETSVPYAAYVILSMGIFTAFINFVEHTADTLKYHHNLLIENKLPFSVLYTQKIIHAMLHYSIPLVSTLLILLLVNVRLHVAGWLLPLLLVPTFFLGIGVGMWLSVFQIVQIDLFTTAKRGIQALVFVTPVLYAKEVENAWLQCVIDYNPLTYLVSLPRDLLTVGTVDYWNEYAWSSLFATVFFLISFRSVVKNAKKITEKMY